MLFDAWSLMSNFVSDVGDLRCFCVVVIVTSVECTQRLYIDGYDVQCQSVTRPCLIDCFRRLYYFALIALNDVMSYVISHLSVTIAAARTVLQVAC